MASVAQICNMALSHIGSDARVSSISPPDGSVEAGHCATFFDQARTELLEPGSWAFALKRAALAQITNTSTGWLFAYTKPSDCLRPLRVLRAGSSDDSQGANYTLEGDTLFTNEEDAMLLYARDVTDVNKFTASFVSALGYLLAAYVAGPIIKGSEGTRVGDAMRQRAMTLIEMSATALANASQSDTEFTASSLAART
jgi:hypothetical protein